jgi:DNA-binding transcriptional LysR family regulator
MHLEALKIFCDVVRWASFSRGAAENNVAQSTASQAVQQLEVRLGVKLIDRSKRPLVLTPHGKVYYEGCKELIGRYLELENRVKAVEDPHLVAGTVHVASIYSIGLHHMTRYVRTFNERYPGASVRLEYLHPTRVVESVLEGGAELDLISCPRKWNELKVIDWREEEMVLAVHPRHRFAGLGCIDVSQLDGETFVGFDADVSIRRVIDRFLRHHNVHVRVALEFDNIENIKRAVEIPEGVAILPEPTLTREVKAGTLVAVRIDGQDPHHRMTRPLAIIHRRHHQLSSTASRFLKLLIGDGEPALAGAGDEATAGGDGDGHVPR